MQVERVRKIGYRKSRAKRRLNVVQSLFFILITVVAAYLFLQSNLFNISELVVQGNQQLKYEDIKQLAAVPVGTNIFKVDLTISDEKLKLNPMIKRVEVRRDFPSTVEITIQEREPLGLIPNHASFLQVDVEGYCVAKVDNINRVDLPIINGMKVDKVMPGQSVAGEGIRSAVNYLDLMQRKFSQITSRVSEINVQDSNNIKLYTTDNIEVRLGDGKRIEEKLNLLASFFSQKYEKPIEYVDVSYDNKRITTKFIEPQGSIALEQGEPATEKSKPTFAEPKEKKENIDKKED